MPSDLEKIEISSNYAKTVKSAANSLPDSHLRVFKNDSLGTIPWNLLACDLFEFHGKLILIVVNMYSKFVFMVPVVDHTTD